MARLIFVCFVIAVLAMLWRGRDSVRGRAGTRLLVLAFGVLVIVTILNPRLTSIVASRIGIGRGSDLVFYLTSFALMFLAALVYLRFKRMDHQIAELTRALALRDADSASPRPAVDAEQPDPGAVSHRGDADQPPGPY